MEFPAWFDHTHGEIIPIRIPADGLLLALISPPTQGSSFAAVFSPEQCKQTLEFAPAWLNSLPGKNHAEVVFRLIGNEIHFQKFSEVLKKVGLKEGTHVPFASAPYPEIHFLPSQGRLRAEKQSQSKRKTRVMVVDDSETIRKLLFKIFSEDPELECVAAVANPMDAEAAIQKYRPDVITLDIHMPQMDGVTLLRRFLPQYKIPTVMITALSLEDGSLVLDALEAGAVDYVQKPSMSELPVLAPLIREKIKDATSAQLRSSGILPSGTLRQRSSTGTLERIDSSFLIAIGSSTGGTEALRELFSDLPDQIPPIVVVQHIPPVFSKAFADRLNGLFRFEVKEAQDGDAVLPNRVLIAPGGKQMKIQARGSGLVTVIEDSPPVNRHKPSVDVLFDSIALLKRKNVVAGILTGMGTDGAKGLLKLKQAGARTFAQDETTSVVYGMPKEAAKLGAAEQILPLDRIADALMRCCSKFNDKGHAKNAS